MSKKERSIRLPAEKMQQANAIADGSYTTFNGLVEMLVDAAIVYHEAEGELPTPVKVVSKRDYERFEAWEREENGKTDKRETA